MTLCVEWVFTFNKDVVTILCKADITFQFKWELDMLNTQLLFLASSMPHWDRDEKLHCRIVEYLSDPYKGGDTLQLIKGLG